MLKRLSFVEEERLTYFLARVREIAALGDEAGLIETDKFIWEITKERANLSSDDEDELDDEMDDEDGGSYYNDRWEESRAKHTLETLRENLSTLKAQLQQNTRINSWTIDRLSEGMDEIENEWEDSIKDKFRAEITALKNEFTPLEATAREQSLTQQIQATLDAPLANAQSVRSILTNVSRIEREHGPKLNDEHRQLIRTSRERACSYRARKTLAEAQVAEAGGNSRKSERLRAEAKVLLAQDWTEAFGTETPPDVATLN